MEYLLHELLIAQPSLTFFPEQDYRHTVMDKGYRRAGGSALRMTNSYRMPVSVRRGQAYPAIADKYLYMVA